MTIEQQLHEHIAAEFGCDWPEKAAHLMSLAATEISTLKDGQTHTVSISELARAMATFYHAGQFRRDGVTPYITHPAAVAAQFDSHTVKAVAWLHDVLEDTAATADQLRTWFSDEIVDAVVRLTKRDGMAYEDYLAIVRQCPIARAVKIADIEHNLSCTPTLRQREKYATALAFLKTAGPPSLFARYIQHVRTCEGVDFITDGTHHNDDAFTAAEWETLQALAQQTLNKE
jgi:hypothetical protein